MSRICDVCQKGYQKGNLVPRGVGRRVLRRTIVKRLPNLRNKRIELNGKLLSVKLCTSCLKKIKAVARNKTETVA